MLIREIQPTDVESCAEIVRRNFNSATAERFIDEVNHCWNTTMLWPPMYFVMEKSNVVIGFAGLMESWLIEGVWDFIWINVDPDHQYKGIGKLLTRHRIDHVLKHGGSAIHLVTRQYRFFRGFDFKVAHIYNDGLALMIRQFRDMTL